MTLTSTPLLIVEGIEVRRTPHGYTIAGHPVTTAGAGAIARWLLAKPVQPRPRVEPCDHRHTDGDTGTCYGCGEKVADAAP